MNIDNDSYNYIVAMVVESNILIIWYGPYTARRYVNGKIKQMLTS